MSKNGLIKSFPVFLILSRAWETDWPPAALWSQASVRPASESISSQVPVPAFQKPPTEKVKPRSSVPASLVKGWGRRECKLGHSLRFQNLPKLKGYIPCVPVITFPGLYLTHLFTHFRMTYELLIYCSNVCNSK